MKKIIVAAAIVLASGITAYSLNNKKNTEAIAEKVKVEKASFSTPAGHGPKSDLATAD